MVRTTRFAAPVFGLRREIDKLFEDTFGNAGAALGSTNGWLPTVDIKETDDALLFDLEMPGVAEDRLEITCERGVLAVAGEKSAAKNESDEGKWHIVERTFGSFRRSFQLPTDVQEENIEATLSHGVLHLRVPKMELPKARKIELKENTK